MDVMGMLVGALKQFWYVIPLLIVLNVIKTPWFKGRFGEFLVNRLLLKLPTESYTLIKDVTLPTEGGTTQIDHVVVSKFGIFVVETKNMKGWIFGTENQKQWTQKIYRSSYEFQNPLRQNYKHIKTLETLLDCDIDHLHSVIVFAGDSTFKTEVPENVTYARHCIHYIEQFKDVVFDDDEYSQLIEDLNQIKLSRGIVTNIKHRQHVRKIVADKEQAGQVKSKATNPKPRQSIKTSNDNQEQKTCSRCGSEMTLRKVRSGEDKGKEFWGCSTYPKCRNTEQLD